jgi:ankyrin repeat protein
MGDVPLMELLITNNANINIQGGNERMTVLHEAILNENCNESIVKFLLENGADPHIKYASFFHTKPSIHFYLQR